MSNEFILDVVDVAAAGSHTPIVPREFNVWALDPDITKEISNVVLPVSMESLDIFVVPTVRSTGAKFPYYSDVRDDTNIFGVNILDKGLTITSSVGEFSVMSLPETTNVYPVEGGEEAGGEYKISGSTSDPMRLLVVNENTWETEKTELVSDGAYEITGLTNGKKLVVGRRTDGESVSYGYVNSVA